MPGERIVPASRLCDAVAAGAPGVVLADHDVASETVAALEGTGVPVVGLTGAAGSAYAVQTNVGLVGRADGAERPAAGLNARIDVVVERYRATAAAAGGRRRVAYYTPAGTSLGVSSAVSNLISCASGRNALQRGPSHASPPAPGRSTSARGRSPSGRG